MRRPGDPLLLALLALSLSANVYLYRRVPGPVHQAGPLKPGEHVPEFSAISPSGSTVDVRFATQPTILYVFSPTCGWCARNLANAKALARQAGGRFQFFAVALDDTDLQHYLAENAIDWPVLTRLPDQVRTAYRFGATPETVVIDKGGVVSHVWLGAFKPRLVDEIGLVLGVRLPGLIDLNAPGEARAGGG